MPAHALAPLLRDEIARRGRIPFSDFMERALYDPDHGYYTSGRARLGRTGDFFTNVSVGPLFGRLLARQFAEMWDRLGRPDPFIIVEQGADRGDFAHDCLSGLRELAPDCFAATRYHIVEPVPALVEAQAVRLVEFALKSRWHRSLADLDPFVGVHFSNELIDAFPVHLVTWTGTEWLERFVALDDEGFTFEEGPLSHPDLRERLALLPPVPDGYQTEISLGPLGWIDAVGAKLERGFVLAIDYGFSREEYYRPERTTGTLSAYAAHRREPDPLKRPGEIDLTAHVDFTSLTERAEERGLRLLAFTDQHHFMVGLSRLHFGETAPTSRAAQQELRAFQTLMHPTLLGRSFKVLCLAKGTSDDDRPFAGFQFAPAPRAALGLAS
jgi:SAM-dependent MidA family methyltransferase